MKQASLLDVRDLRLGLHVQLELGWMAHPFPLNSFRLTSPEQLDTLRGLGLKQVRVLAERSEPEAVQALVQAGVLPPTQAPAAPSADAAAASPPLPAPAPPPAAAAPESAEERARRRRRAALDAEHACQALAEKRYCEAGRAVRRSTELVRSAPQDAREHCEAQVQGLLTELLGEDELAIRLLSEGAGDRASLHAVNVAVISLLLGQQIGLAKDELFDLGVGALLHDIGKTELPDRVRWVDALSSEISTHERQFYQEHVKLGIGLGQQMSLAPGALAVLAQHHELADGSGFPRRLPGEHLSAAAKVVALVNRYDNLCNPSSPPRALTPHEALALMYGQMKAKFDAVIFGAFIRMMGVYPPGSVVQLSDERYALVIAVNAARPLKPRVLVHEPKLAREEALPLDLESTPGLGIRRSLKPQQLPRAALEWLSPRPRIGYFFERAREPFVAEEPAP